MKKNFRILGGCVLASAVFLSGFGACSKSGAAGEKPRIAVVLKTLSSPFWQSALIGAREAAAQYGYELIALGPHSEDAVSEQINIMEDLLAEGRAAGIVFAPSQPPAAVNVLNRAKAAGIPVAIIDTPMPEGYTNYLTYIGSDNYHIGVLGATAMLKILPAGAKVAILEGAPGNPSMTERADGAEKVFRDAGIVIQSRQPAYSDRNQALNIIQNVLQSDPDTAGVFSANDDQAEGAYRAFVQNGRKGVVMGVDGNRSAKESVRDNGLFGTVAQDIFSMGFLGVESIHKAINGLPVEKKIDVPAPVITKENVAQYL
ncbi:MAG: sugar ABC transporter substrate-binding protein [Treponema sp.]|jgi:ribose transport system substrate-binding protein|nr:sugar ABC transporter substrate-binding protein [Treponema sp.]